MILRGKKILFFSPKAFGYEVAIRRRLEELGATVVYYDDRPSNGFWGKAMLRVSKRSMAVKIETYYREIFKELQSYPSFDYIFLLNLEAMPVWFLKKIKAQYQGCPVILYMWDSFRNKVHTKDYLEWCDRAISFDYDDQKQNPKLEFRPLFYLNEYSSIAGKKDFDYDISFVATAHSDRFTIAQNIKKQVEGWNGVAYNYFYLQSKKLFLYLKLTNPTFKHTHSSDFKYKSLKTDEILNVIAKSKSVLDVQHPKQTGLTMRTLEMLGAERKLITTNPAIQYYDFYNPNNICIINRNNPTIAKDFFNKPYEPVSKELYHKYSLDGWLEYIFQ
jgi:hypothetical protein